MRRLGGAPHLLGTAPALADARIGLGEEAEKRFAVARQVGDEGREHAAGVVERQALNHVAGEFL